MPLLWRVIEHKSASVSFEEYHKLLRQARWVLRHHPDIMLLTDRGFTNHEFIEWLERSAWHYCLRLPCDVFVHGLRRYATAVTSVLSERRSSLSIL